MRVFFLDGRNLSSLSMTYCIELISVFGSSVFVLFSIRSLTPAISSKAAKAIRQKVCGWNWQLRPGDTLEDLALECNPIVRGWINYYGRFNPSAMSGILHHINWRLVRWATCKYKKLKGRQQKATRWLGQIAERQPNIFVHWRVLSNNDRTIGAG